MPFINIVNFPVGVTAAPKTCVKHCFILYLTNSIICVPLCVPLCNHEIMVRHGLEQCFSDLYAILVVFNGLLDASDSFTELSFVKFNAVYKIIHLVFFCKSIGFNLL